MRRFPRARRRGLPAAQWLVALAILLAGAALATVLLLEREPRLAGTNSVRPDAFVVGLNRGDVACQTNVLLPGDSAGVRVLVGSYGRPGPRLDATVRSASGAVLRSGSAAGYADGSWVDIRFAPVRPFDEAIDVGRDVEQRSPDGLRAHVGRDASSSDAR